MLTLTFTPNFAVGLCVSSSPSKDSLRLEPTQKNVFSEVSFWGIAKNRLSNFWMRLKKLRRKNRRLKKIVLIVSWGKNINFLAILTLSASSTKNLWSLKQSLLQFSRICWASTRTLKALMTSRLTQPSNWSTSLVTKWMNVPKKSKMNKRKR